MKNATRVIILLILIGINAKGFAQTHQWAKSIPNAGAIGTSIAIDSSSNTYMMGLHRDTLFIDSNAFPPEAPANFEGNFLAKFNKNGKLKWCKQLYVALPSSTSYAHFYIQGLVSLSKNRLLIYGVFTGGGGGKVLKLSKTDSVLSFVNGYTGFLAIYDSLGNVIKSTKVYEGPDYNWGHFINEKATKDSKGNIYIQFQKSKSAQGKIYYVGGTIALTDTVMRNVVVKYSANLDSVLWFKEFPDFKNFWVLRISTGEDDNLYLACNGLSGTFTLDGKNYRVNTQTKGFLTVLSPSGGFVHTGFINEDTTLADQLWDMKAKNLHSIYIMGAVKDSMLIKGKWYKPFIKKKSAGDLIFIGKISITKGAKWIKISPNTTNFNIYSGGGNIPGRIAFDKFNNVYASFYLWSKGFSIGGLTDTNYVYHPFMKLDSLGNALWIRNFLFRGEDFQADYDTNIVFSGAYNGQIYFNPFTLKSKYTSLFLAKIIDYSIKRGFVSNKPYCAGDTIIVPYSKRGIYDSSNYFIAELSDENGNFDGNERELGRLKTVKEGSVKGVLPMFRVASSNNYRIRIRSTNPVVQSFYRVDTLRLLIYSRDKADPGPTETICYADTFKLNTYGGTKWTWSPKYNMNDSNKRQPLIWPTHNITYKIIIADSSGCGAPDTAYKLIIVRPPLKIHLAFNDTTICGNNLLRLPFYFTGGDSVNYKFQWYYVSSPKLWFALTGGQKLRDTLNRNIYSPNETLAIILKDGCTNKPDTAYLTISQSKPIVINTTFKDTTLCNGQTLKYKASASGGVAKYYNWQWKDMLSNTVLSTTDSLSLITSKTLKVQLVVNDGCEAVGDTAMFEVKVKSELKATTNLRDSTLCSGKTNIYTATGKGGDTTAYKFNWVLNNTLIDTGSNLTSNLTSTSTLSLILKDNCSKSDTITKTITIKPAPKADFTWDLACSKTITKFQFTGTKPAAPITTSFRWNFNNEAISSLENPSHKFSSAGISTSTLILNSSNGCNDTLKKTIIIKLQSKADFTANDVCETDSAVFINKSIDATSYSWRFGDGLKSTKMSPKHLYNIGGVTKTYNVSLVAVVKDGCSDSIIKAISINSNPNSNFTYVLTGKKLDLKATVQGLTKYRWKFGANDSVTTTSGTYTHYFTKPGLHTICLKVFNLAECTSQTCQSMTVGISTIAKPSGFKIYPNPNTGNFTIEIENPTKDVSIEVYDLLGNLIKTIETTPSKKSYSIEMNVADGIYVVRVDNGGMVWNQKVSVVR